MRHLLSTYLPLPNSAMRKAQVLIVDDEADILELLKITLSRMGIGCRETGDIKGAERLLASNNFDLCLTDMCLPDGSGIDLVRYIVETRPDLPAAAITARGNLATAIAAMKTRAFDFVAKPLGLKTLRRLVESASRPRSGTKQAARTRPSSDHGGLLRDSLQIPELRRLIAKLTRSQAPVFISGESGTGPVFHLEQYSIEI